MTNPLDNPIGFLQEFCQKHRANTFPYYNDIGASGPDHCRKFSCKCVYDGLEVIGTGNQKKHAKFEAAKLMYELLLKKNYFEKFNIHIKSENLDDTDSSSGDTKESTLKHPISALQEYCQASKFVLPNYFESSSANGFVCECALQDHKTYGHGPTKKAAKTQAAQEMCMKLNVLVSIQKDCKSEVEEEEHFNKNAISLLQEFASRRKKPAPEYEDKGFILGSFVIACSMGSMTAEGRDTTKKGAKLEAAHKLLNMIIASESIETGISYQALSHTNAPLPVCSLEEFNLDSDEDEEKDDKSTLSINKQLESLSLDDQNTGTTVKVKVEGDNTIVAVTSGKNDEKSEDNSNELATTENQNSSGEAGAKEGDSSVVNGTPQQKDVDSLTLTLNNEGSRSKTVNQDPSGEAFAKATAEGDHSIVNGTSPQKDVDSKNSEEKINEGSHSKTINQDRDIENAGDGFGICNVFADTNLSIANPQPCSSCWLASLQGQTATLTGVFDKSTAKFPLTSLKFRVHNIKLEQE